MKKIFSFGAIAAAVMAFAGCAQEIEQPEVPQQEGVAYELVAEVSTKTVNDGMSTKWAKDDALNVFFTEAGSDSYGSNNQFTIVDVEEGKFEGTLTTYPDPAKNYDWYALYPYAAKIQSPANDSAGYTYIGHSKGVTQSEYGSKDGLDDTNCPLYAVLKNHPGAERVSLTMAHLTSVIELKVTNGQDEELTINSAYISVPGQKIVGSFFINYAGDEVKYTPSGENYVKEFAQVNVTNPTALAKGETASLYFVVKPFVLAEGDTWSIAINDQNSAVEKNAPVEISFKAGEIFTVNYTYAPAASEEPETPVEPEFTAGEYWIVADGKYALPVSGNYGYLNLDTVGYQDNVFTFAEVEGGYTIQQSDGKYLFMSGDFNNFNVTTSPTSGHIWTVKVNDDGTYVIMNVDKNKYIQLSTQYKSYGSYAEPQENAVLPTLVDASEAQIRPILEVSSQSITVVADVTECSFNITSNLSWTITPCKGVTLDKTSGEGNATINLSFVPNDAESEVVYTVTISAEGMDDIIVTVTQTGAGEAEPVKETLNTYANKGTLANKTITWTGTYFTCSNEQGASTNAIRTSDSDHFRAYQGSVLKFNALDEKKFKDITVTCTSSEYASNLANSAISAGYDAVASSSKVTITVDLKSEVVISMTKQSRFKLVEVTLK